LITKSTRTYRKELSIKTKVGLATQGNHSIKTKVGLATQGNHSIPGKFGLKQTRRTLVVGGMFGGGCMWKQILLFHLETLLHIWFDHW
jgi:hypothetical protein